MVPGDRIAGAYHLRVESLAHSHGDLDGLALAQDVEFRCTAGAKWREAVRTSSASMMGAPLRVMITSSTRTPAFAAGPLESSCSTNAPVVAESPSDWLFAGVKLPRLAGSVDDESCPKPANSAFGV